eukprot:TRINITY_DN32_c0_g1_i1.p1 TRINITY_DN32_c0_g1~~TRINITY_DN32_c0_g1_i1.p1  ORF type:complete len:134 (+),score=24.23 TRINITY_DN32_c0_g1_i1:95-496(+)
MNTAFFRNLLNNIGSASKPASTQQAYLPYKPSSSTSFNNQQQSLLNPRSVAVDQYKDETNYYDYFLENEVKLQYAYNPHYTGSVASSANVPSSEDGSQGNAGCIGTVAENKILNQRTILFGAVFMFGLIILGN